MWAEERVFYQIYPLGFCGAERRNEFNTAEDRLGKITDYIPHMTELGINAIYFSPIFQSSTHGYDTVDYRKIDTRLGTNEQFKDVVKKLHDNNIKVVLDGVFNHMGRDCPQFTDVRINRENSRYKDWFIVNFFGNNEFNDGLSYEGWEGHNSMVKLNQHNCEVKNHIFDAIRYWIEYFDIDGIRLDVCYSLENVFLDEIRRLTNELKKDFWLMGEVIHGDYKKFVNQYRCDSVTNYECYKGMFSAFNDKNLFEIAHSINRQFGSESWTLYKGLHLYNFVDNHDVERIATKLKDKADLQNIYTLMFCMNGIPSIYYGSEYGILGDKSDCDYQLRPNVSDIPKTDTALYEHIKKLIEVYKKIKALCYGDYKQLYLSNGEYAFIREYNSERVITAINIGDKDKMLNLGVGEGIEILTGEKVDLGAVSVKARSGGIYLCDAKIK